MIIRNSLSGLGIPGEISNKICCYSFFPSDTWNRIHQCIKIDFLPFKFGKNWVRRSYRVCAFTFAGNILFRRSRMISRAYSTCTYSTILYIWLSNKIVELQPSDLQRLIFNPETSMKQINILHTCVLLTCKELSMAELSVVSTVFSNIHWPENCLILSF